MALVGQEPRLFGGSIRQNICLGLEEKPTDDKIKTALKLANASSFVEALPEVWFFFFNKDFLFCILPLILSQNITQLGDMQTVLIK